MSISINGAEAIGQDDPAALCPDAARRGLQQSNDPQTELATAQWSFAFANTLREIGHDPRQRFLRRDMWTPDIAGPVIDLGFAPGFVARSHVNAAIIHLD